MIFIQEGWWLYLVYSSQTQTHLHQCRNQPCPGAVWPRAGTPCGFPISVNRKEKYSLHLNTAGHGTILLNKSSYQQCVQSINECERKTEGNKQRGYNEGIWLLNLSVIIRCFKKRDNILQTKLSCSIAVVQLHSKKQEWIMPLKNTIAPTFPVVFRVKDITEC